MKKKIIVISVICLVVIALGIIIPVTIANKNKDKNPTIESRVIVVTEMVKSNSNAQVLISNNGLDTTCATGIRLKSGDTVTTDDSSIVYFTCDNDKVFRINENSRIYIDEASSKKLKVKLLDGEIYFNVKTKLQDDESLDVVAGSTTMSVRGTIGNISYDTESGDLLVLVPEGKLACSSDSGTVEYATPGIGVKSSNDAIETLEVSVNEYPDNLLYEIIRDQETLDRVIEAFNEVVEDASEIIEFFEEKAEELEAKNNEHPEYREAHKALAKEVITFIHGENAYNEAVKISECLFSGKVNELNAKQIEISFQDFNAFELKEDTNIIDVLVLIGAAKSKSEARQFLSGGGVYINGESQKDFGFMVTKQNAIEQVYTVIRRGKKNYYLIKHE